MNMAHLKVGHIHLDATHAPKHFVMLYVINFQLLKAEHL